MANQITVNSGTGNITVTTSRSVIGTVANVASANYANFAGQVVDANQPNITQVGTLTTLNVSGTTTVDDLVVTGNLQVGNLVANNANYANFAGVAYSVNGSNVSGAVANATFATSAAFATSAGNAANATYADNAGNANIANTAYAVSGANVSGSVANANYANIAGTAYSVSVGNVSGIGNIATINLDGNSSNVLRGDGTFSAEAGNLNANYANFAGNAFSVDGANVNGSVANANYANIAGTAYSVDGANVSGIVANANYANISGTAYSVSGANVSGAVANATYANDAGNANTANYAANVTASNQPNITAVGNLTSLQVGSGTNDTLRFTPVGSNLTLQTGNVVVGQTRITTATAPIDAVVLPSNAALTSTYTQQIFTPSGTNVATIGSIIYNTDAALGAGNAAQAGTITQRVFTAGADLANANVGTSLDMSLGTSGVNLLQKVPPTGVAAGSGLIQTTSYGESGNVANQVGLRFQRRRGNNNSRLSVEPNDYLGNIEWRAGRGGSNYGTNTAKLSAKVDGAYTANTNPVPIGFELVVCNTSSTITHNFYANGNVSLAGSISATNIGNVAAANFDGNSNNVLLGSGSFGASPTPTKIQNGNSVAQFTGPGGDLTIDIDGRQYATFNYGRQLVLEGIEGDSSNAAQIKLDNGGMQVINEDLGGGLPSFEFKSYYNSGGTIAPYVFQRARGNLNVPANAQSGDAIMNQTFQAYSNTGFVGAGGFSATVANNDNAGNIRTNIELSTQNLGDGSQIKLLTDVVNVAANSAIYLNANDSNVSGNLTVNGNITGQANVNVNGTIVLANTVQIDSPGYYLPYGFSFNGGMPNSNVVFSVNVQGDVTSGGNVISNVALYDAFTGSPLSLNTYAPLLANLSLIPQSVQGVGSYNAALPVLGTISNVDTSNSTITYSNNFNATTSLNVNTGVIAYNTPTDTYFGINRTVFATATATDSTTNEITLDTVDPIDFGAGVGSEIVFVGTSFGNIAANTVYYVDSVVSGNTAITISTSSGGPVHTLTTATGSMTVTQSGGVADTIIPNTTGFYAGPWDTVPTYGNLTLLTNPNFATTPTITIGSLKPVNYNDNPPNDIPGGFIANIQYNQLVGPTVVGTEGAPTLTGRIFDGFGVNGITAINDGTDANLSGLRTTFATIAYTDGGSDSASITNPGNPTGVQFTTYTGNSTNDPSDYYLRSGRSLGRIAWYASQQVGGQYYANPGTSPYAGIYAQALGDWNDAVNTSLPMVFAFQYSPLNAATGGGTNYQRINRTFLQAANNTTSIGGATNIEFKPLARSNNGTNNRSPSALGNVSINPQTFVDIRGYTAGNAVSNGAGAVLNVTTTASTWNGDVALRLSRTVSNTANMEFKLPVGSANTMVLVDNASGNTLATFTDGYANFTGQLNSLRTYASFYNPNDIAITANTVANLDLPNTYSANGVSIVSNNQITIARAGTYNIQMSLQLTNSDNASEHDFDVWFAKNGTDIADSATQYTVIKNNGKNVVALNFVDTCNANDYYQIRYASQSANISIEAFASQSTPYVRPAIPSAIVTVVPVGA